MLQVKSIGEGTTRRIGYHLGKIAPPGTALALSGELGAGKTVFAQGVGAGLGVKEMVNSPSYVLMNLYRGRLEFYHFDFYRLSEEEELLELGLEEYFYGEGLTLIEWADRFPHVLPTTRLEVEIRKDYRDVERSRLLIFQPRGELDSYFLEGLSKIASFGA